MAQLATESQTAENSQPGSPQVSEQQIACMAADLFVSMLSMDLEYEPGTEFESIDGSLQSTVEISGTWSARLRVVASSDLTATIACAMFDMDLEELTDSELHDALGEVANMIGGNVKGLANGHETHLSLPQVEPAESEPMNNAICAVFLCCGLPMYVQLVTY